MVSPSGNVYSSTFPIFPLVFGNTFILPRFPPQQNVPITQSVSPSPVSLPFHLSEPCMSVSTGWK